MNKEDVLVKIEKHYKLALEYINKEQYKLAEKQIYELLGLEEYDLSLDIMYNNNEKYKDESLRTLISQVDSALTLYSKLSREECDEKIDKFNNRMF